jgi:hypothetical protein
MEQNKEISHNMTPRYNISKCIDIPVPGHGGP